MRTKNPYKNPLYREIWDLNNRQKRDVLIFITGPRGTGKSQLGNKIGFDLDENYRNGDPMTMVKERVIREPDQFTEIFNKDLPEGSFIMFDEIGVGASAREWWSFVNIALSKLVQVVRYKKYIIVFTAPSFRFVDAHLRQMFNYMIITKRVAHSQHTVRFKLYRLDYDKIEGKLYKRHLINNNTKIKRWKFKRVSTRWFNAYEKYSKQFKGDIIDELALANRSRRLKDIEKNKVKPDLKKIAEEVADKWKDIVTLYHGAWVVPVSKVSVRYNLGDYQARRVKVMAEDILKERGSI